MKTFALRNGDLELSGDRYSMISGPARVQQQLGLCMREPWRGDRFHRGWGSVLPSWVGRVLDPGIEMEVGAEVRRIVRNMTEAIASEARRRAEAGLAPVLNQSEIITGVSAVRIQRVQDRLYVLVTVQTASAREFTVLTSPGAA